MQYDDIEIVISISLFYLIYSLSVFISDLWENIDDGSLRIAPFVVSSANSVSTYMYESFSMSFYQIYLGQILHCRYLALKY